MLSQNRELAAEQGRDNSFLRGFVTNDGKTVAKAAWGALPTGYLKAEDESEEEESSDEEMDESEEEAEEGEEGASDKVESVLPPPLSSTRRPHPWICANNLETRDSFGVYATQAAVSRH
jgi:hypothetical protein